MNNDRAKSLLEKYTSGKCSPEEKALIEHWYRLWNKDQPIDLSEEKIEHILTNVQQGLPVKPQRTQVIYLRVAAVAALFIVMIGLGVWYVNRPIDKNTAMIASTERPINKPIGKDKPTLTLSNGRVVALAETKTTLIIDATKFVYEDGSVISENSIQENQGSQDLVVQTPRGTTYRVKLPDNSEVWLNAGSKLSFPSSFDHAHLRQVKLEGEAYFEVEKDKNKPFIVLANDKEIKVLGTKFNVNNYPDEVVFKATLLSGSISLKTKNELKVLKPGYQARVSPSGISLHAMDVSDAIAWKNGNFIFNNVDLEGIMRQIARWYDVEIVYEDAIPQLTFVGELSREKSLSSILKILEKSGKIHFKVEGRRVIVQQ